jgi:ABC-type taurine transport system ATPase subunit
MSRITLDRIDKRYPNGYVAARELSLEIADGELLVLVGSSGPPPADCSSTTATSRASARRSATLPWSSRATRSTRT